MAVKTHRCPGKEALSSPTDGLAHLTTPPLTVVCDQTLNQEMRIFNNHPIHQPCYGSHLVGSRGSVQGRGAGWSGVPSLFFPLGHTLLRRRTRHSRKLKLEHRSAGPTSVEFSSLPLEIVQEIFSYFPQRELCLLAQVSKAWRDYVYDPIHWQKLSFELNHNLDMQVLKSITDRAPLLRKLSLRGQENLTVMTEVEFFTKNCSLMEDVDVSYLSTVDYSVVHILSQNCQALRSLSVEGCALLDQQCIALLCQELCGLRTLNLSGCTLLSDESVIMLALSLAQIHRLNIDGIPAITDKYVEVYATELNCFTCEFAFSF